MLWRLEETTKNFAAEQTWRCVKEKSAKGKLQGKRSTPTSVSGPPSWRKVPAKHREVLTITRDPPGNEPDVTQNGKGRQCVSARFAMRRCSGSSVGSRTERKYRNATTCLRTEQAMVDSRRLQPHCCDSRDCKHNNSGAGRESYSGGRATWASFFLSSSG